MNDKSQVESILSDIKSIVDNVIIKLSYQAEQYETADIKREADKYINASLERDTFNSYRYYPMDVLARAGITNLNDLHNYSENKFNIPREKRNDVLKAMRQTVINEYVEENDYYRELIGKPSINTPESEWIYLTDAEMEYYNIDEYRPIHEYPLEIQLKLERGLLPQLIELYPEKTYLKHMGSKAVNLLRARNAGNFEIIFTDVDLDPVFLRAFFDTYDFAREYFVSIIYNKAFKDRYNLYDNYIGMHIMIMTIQRLVVDTIKMGIDRDFYDLISVRKLFNVYGVPFFEDLPLDYQRTIVKNVNMLIRAKSTDKVLYDIANTLFYERVKIYKYYLVKERKFDENGEPVFKYKKEILDNSPAKIYLKNEKDVCYELMIDNDRLVTTETQLELEYVPDHLIIKDIKTGKPYKLHINGDRINIDDVEYTTKIHENPLIYNINNDKYELLIEDGELQTVFRAYNVIDTYDYQEMFNVYFQAADIMEQNVITTMETKYNRYHYQDVVSDDVYWWETEELKKELYEREYNFVDTKYISITVMQNLTKMIYETSYFLNLIVDHKNTDTDIEQRIFNADAMKIGTDYLYIKADRLTSVPISLFDTIMLLCAMISKKNGMKGNIIVNSPSQILSVLGFNFEANFDLIRENIKKYKRIFKNQEIVKYLDLLDIRTVGDIDTLYNNFKNFSDFCIEMLANTTDINEYKAYKELYKVFTVRKDSTELFKKSDGTIATTYLDYIYDKIPVVAKQIDELNKDKMGVYIEHVLGKLNELIPEIEYLNTLNGTNNNIVQAITGLINFFKSYTVDLRTLNVMYMFDNRALNKIYMIDDPRLMAEIFPNDTLPIYNDTLTTAIRMDKYNNLIIYDKHKINNSLLSKQYVGQYADINQLLNALQVDDELELDYKDIMGVFKYIDPDDDVIDLRDESHIYDMIEHKSKFNTESKLMTYNLLNIQTLLEFDYKDVMIFLKYLYINNKMKLEHRHKLIYTLLQAGKLNLEQVVTFCLAMQVNDNIDLDYKDLFRCADVNYWLDHVINLNYSRNIIDNILTKEKYEQMSLIELQNLLEQQDIMELDYKEIIFSIAASATSGSSIMLNDSIKVIYEE